MQAPTLVVVNSNEFTKYVGQKILRILLKILSNIK